VQKSKKELESTIADIQRELVNLKQDSAAEMETNKIMMHKWVDVCSGRKTMTDDSDRSGTYHCTANPAA
jgi:hypothetical protein